MANHEYTFKRLLKKRIFEGKDIKSGLIAFPSRKLNPDVFIRRMMIYCEHKHNHISFSELAKRYCSTPKSVQCSYYTVKRQIDKWENEASVLRS